MKKWLFKSDPEHYSFADLLRDGLTTWDGVWNNTALKHLRAVRRGDLILIYHTGLERAILGIAEALSDAYPDPKLRNPKQVVIDLAAREKLSREVLLSEVRIEAARHYPSLRNFDLLRLPRLSVMPVSEEQWAAILALSRK